MRRAAKVDSNQGNVVAALRKVGASVTQIHMVGQGCPDLLVGFQGRTLVLEVKDGSKPPSARKLTDDEAMWFGNWRGEAYVVETPEQAIECLTRRAS